MGDGRPAVWIGLGLLAYYLLIMGGHQYSIDGIAMFQASKALLFQHSWRFDPPLHWGQEDIAVSRWPPGMTLAYLPLLVPWFPVFSWFPGLRTIPYDRSLPHNPALYANLPYLLCSVLNPLVTAGTACLILRIGRMLGLRREWSAVAALAYGLASPAAAYARYDFAQPLATLALTATVWGLLRAEETTALLPLGWASIAFGYGLLTRPELVVLAPWILGWVYLRRRRDGVRAAGILAGGVVLMLLAYVGITWLKFGDSSESLRIPLWILRARSITGFLEGLAGLLVSPGRGLLLFFPLAWLALPGLYTWRRHGASARSLFGGIIAILVAFYAAFPIWWGGWCWGPRFLLPILPLLTLAATSWAAADAGEIGRRRLAVFLLLGALGFAVSWNGILSDGIFHTTWVHRTLGLPETGATLFRPAASPLITGWSPRPGQPFDAFWIDIAWVKLASGRLRMPGDQWIGVLLPLVLLVGLAWAGRRVVSELRAPERG